MTNTGWPRAAPQDPWGAHAERLRRVEERQAEAERWLSVLREQIRLLRERAGLAIDEEGPW